MALCCLSPLGQFLQYQYGWRGGFLILGGILLNCCVCGALMRPLLPDRKHQAVEGPKNAHPKKKLLDFSVFRDRGFVVYTLAASIMVLGLFVPPVFVVNYAKSLGYEDTKSALLLTILGFVDMFARPAAGLVTGTKWARPRSAYLLCFAILFNGCTDLIGSQVTMQLLQLLTAERLPTTSLVCLQDRPVHTCWSVPGQGSLGGEIRTSWSPPSRATLCTTIVHLQDSPSLPCRLATIQAWWSSVSSLACLTAWWGLSSSRFLWLLWGQKGSPAPSAWCCCWRLWLCLSAHREQVRTPTLTSSFLFETDSRSVLPN